VLDSPNHELLRPAAALGAVRAGRALRRVASLLGEWAAVAPVANGAAGRSTSLPEDGSSV